MPSFPYIAYMSKPEEPYNAIIKANVIINHFINNVYGIQSLFKKMIPFSASLSGIVT